MINIDSFQELVESMDIIAENKFKTASQIYYCLVKSTTSGSKCVIDFNNKEYIVPYFAGTPIPNKTYALFLPQNNMNQAFVIGEGGGGGGGGSGIAVQPDPPTGGELVWIDTDDPGELHIIPEINDNTISQYDTWSSQKIASSCVNISNYDSTTNSYYCKMPDGTLMQWGTLDITSGTTSSYSPIYILNVSITFPISFYNSAYVINGSAKYGTGAELAFGQGTSYESRAIVRLWDTTPRTASSSNIWRVKWSAIGRWKA